MIDDKKDDMRAKNIWWISPLEIFGRLSAWIIGPVLVGVFLGKWLENKYHHEPWLFLSTVGFFFIISMVGLVKTSLEEIKKLEKTSPPKSLDKS